MTRAFKPLRGVRVLAFETAFALPAATRALADLGADVVRITPPDPAEGRRGLENFLNDQDVRINKATLALNLGDREGLALAHRLIARADIVCSNLRPGVMERFGFTYPELCALRPDLIVLRLSGYGSPGPWQGYPALGPATEAAGGLNALIGDASYPPMRAGSDIYADQVGGRYAVLALLTALAYRRRTGEGQEIDLSMHEGIVHLLGDIVLSAAHAGHAPERYGNRDPRIAPQGNYPCAGRDEWLAISVVTDGQWRALRDLLDDPALGKPAFERLEGRRQHHDEIDAAISAWTREREKDVAAQELQDRGIPAGPVRRPADFPLDPQLAQRGALQEVQHAAPLMDKMSHPHLTSPWRVAGYARARLSDPKGEGSDNAGVLKAWLSLSKRDVARMEARGVLWPAQPLLHRAVDETAPSPEPPTAREQPGDHERRPATAGARP